jgi:hypothetical protein
MTGPPYNYGDEKALYGDLAAVWKSCSMLIHNICKENSIEYYHFLQLNQYVPVSKIISKSEARLALWDEQPYKKGVINGYPCLIKAGAELFASGVNFYDLTMIFHDNAELLYADTCCHLNEKGYRIVGDKIGQMILEDKN